MDIGAGAGVPLGGRRGELARAQQKQEEGEGCLEVGVCVCVRAGVGYVV